MRPACRRSGQYFFLPSYRGVAGQSDRAFFFFFCFRENRNKDFHAFAQSRYDRDLSGDNWTVEHTCKKLWALEILIRM